MEDLLTLLLLMQATYSKPSFLSAVQFSSVHLFHQFMNKKEYTFTIRMNKTSRKKERKRQTVNYYKNQI